MLTRILVALNNSTNYSLTNLTLNQVIYSFKTRELLDLLRIKDLDLAPNSARVNLPTSSTNAFLVTRN